MPEIPDTGPIAPPDQQTPPDKDTSNANQQEKPEIAGGPDEESKKFYDTQMQALQGVNERLNDMYKRATTTDQSAARLQPEIDALKASIAKTDASAAQRESQTPPPPPSLNQQQQGTVATAISGLLKIAAVAALAYGMKGRGRFHNAMFKLALGSFFQSYAESKQKTQQASQQLWEKNWQMYKEYVQENHRRNSEILADERLSTTQKMDLIHAESQLVGEERTRQAAERQDLTAVAGSLRDQMRLYQSHEKEAREHIVPLYDTLGKTDHDKEYRSWVMNRPGGEKDLEALNTDPGAAARLEKDHPWSEFLKEKHEADNKAAEEKASEERQQKEQEEAKEWPVEEARELDLAKKKYKIEHPDAHESSSGAAIQPDALKKLEGWADHINDITPTSD